MVTRAIRSSLTSPSRPGRAYFTTRTATALPSRSSPARAAAFRIARGLVMQAGPEQTPWSMTPVEEQLCFPGPSGKDQGIGALSTIGLFILAYTPGER